jgi:hypothetical protein
VFWGQADLKYGSGDIDVGGSGFSNITYENTQAYEVFGRIGADFGKFGAQLDLSYVDQDVPSREKNYGEGKFAALRGTYRLAPTLSLGAVYGGGDANTPSDNQTHAFHFYALDGAFSSGAGVYGLQLGQFDSTDSTGTDAFHDGSFVRAAAIYSLGGAGVIEGEIAYFDGIQDSPRFSEMHVVSWSVEYSRQIAANPFAVSVGLEGGHYVNRAIGGFSYGETRVTLGLTTWFGDGDLASAKQRGIFSQPEFGRIIQAGNNVD